MLPRSLASHSGLIPRLVLERFVGCFRDADSSFVTVTVRNVKHLLRLNFPPEEFHASAAPPLSTPLPLSCRLQRRTTGSVCRGGTTSRLNKPPSFPRIDHPTVKRREERKENKKCTHKCPKSSRVSSAHTKKLHSGSPEVLLWGRPCLIFHFNSYKGLELTRKTDTHTLARPHTCSESQRKEG